MGGGEGVLYRHFFSHITSAGLVQILPNNPLQEQGQPFKLQAWERSSYETIVVKVALGGNLAALPGVYLFSGVWLGRPAHPE
jgi:hypothetical protein